MCIKPTRCSWGCSTNIFVLHLLRLWSLSSQSSKHHYSQTVRVRKLKFLGQYSSPTSCVTHNVSHVTFFVLLFYEVLELVGEGLLSTGPTPSSLPKLVVLSPTTKAKCQSLPLATTIQYQRKRGGLVNDPYCRGYSFACLVAVPSSMEKGQKRETTWILDQVK